MKNWEESFFQWVRLNSHVWKLLMSFKKMKLEQMISIVTSVEGTMPNLCDADFVGRFGYKDEILED